MKNVQFSPDVIVQQLGDQTVLLHMQTNRFYELNRTASRFVELLKTEENLNSVRSQMLEEFDVESTQLGIEIEHLLSELEKERLVTVYE